MNGSPGSRLTDSLKSWLTVCMILMKRYLTSDEIQAPPVWRLPSFEALYVA